MKQRNAFFCKLCFPSKITIPPRGTYSIVYLSWPISLATDTKMNRNSFKLTKATDGNWKFCFKKFLSHATSFILFSLGTPKTSRDIPLNISTPGFRGCAQLFRDDIQRKYRNYSGTQQSACWRRLDQTKRANTGKITANRSWCHSHRATRQQQQQCYQTTARDWDWAQGDSGTDCQKDFVRGSERETRNSE